MSPPREHWPASRRCALRRKRRHKQLYWQGLPKADKLELIAQKATELGAWEIWPVEMLRSVARLGKTTRKSRSVFPASRWKPPSRADALMCRRMRGAVSFEKALKRLEEEPFDLMLVAWEEGRRPAAEQGSGEMPPVS